MKSFLAVIALVVAAVGEARAASTDGFKKLVEPLAQECRPQVEGATDVDVANVVNREELGTRSGKCLQMCVYEKLGGIKDDKLASHDEALAVLHRVYDGDTEKLLDAKQKIDHCGEEVMAKDLDDMCEVANALQQCFRKLH